MGRTPFTVCLTYVLRSAGILTVLAILGNAACHPSGGESKIKSDASEDSGGGSIAPASAYAQVAFDHEQHLADVGDCSGCHHPQPDAAEKACDECHGRREVRFIAEFDTDVPKLKDAMHDSDRGCRSCHDATTEDGLWDCGYCHTALGDS